MKVLIGCEFSGIVRGSFLLKGHDVLSCDLLPTEKTGSHYQGDIRDCFNEKWDLFVCFPPCTHICVSGARWFKDKQVEQKEAISFFMEMINAPVERIAIENPIGIMSTIYRKPDQIIQPWQYGHGETKATCLWLKNLPKLKPSNIVGGREARVHLMPPSTNRGLERSRTYSGIAHAMADQWG